MKVRKITVSRDKSEWCNKKIKIGKFTDGYHASLFIKSVLDEALDMGIDGALVIKYNFTDEEEEG